jgi:integrase
MGSARDSSPDPNHATVSARPPLPERAWPLPSASSAPATRPRPPGPLSKSEARGSPPIPVPAGVRPLDRQPKLLDRLRDALRARHYNSPRTEQTYCHWACLPRREASRRRQVKSFIFFHHVRHPAEMGEPEVNAFLTSLAVKEKVSASTQNQALSALLFLYRYVRDRPLGHLSEVVRARKSHRLPVVLTRQEVRAVLSRPEGHKWRMASLGLHSC